MAHSSSKSIPRSTSRPMPTRSMTEFIRRSTSLGAVLSTLLSLTACSTGPVYHTPPLELPANYQEANPNWKVATPLDTQPKGQWWLVFQDPQLNELMTQIEVGNQNLKNYQAQYRQATALASQARSAQFPVLTTSVGQTRSFTGASAGTGNSNNGNNNGNVNTNYRLSASASWEPDLWGNLSQALDAATAGQEASLADLQAATLSIQTEVAKNYFALRMADTRTLLLQDLVNNFEKALQISQNQYQVGLVTKADVASAQTQVKSTQTQVVQNQLQRTQLEHAIAVLLGHAPAHFSIPAHTEPYTQRPPTFMADIPAHLLERRPDIAAAERRVAQANAKIGVTQAAFFPNLSFSISGGYQSSKFSDWLTYPARFWSLGPTLAQTLFDAELRQAQQDAAWASYDQTAAQYRQTVLTALQEVEDNLAAQRSLHEQAKLQEEALHAAQQALTLNLNQYQAGTTNLLSVLNAQATVLSNQQSSLSIQNDQFAAAINLIAALGGGNSPQLHEAPSM